MYVNVARCCSRGLGPFLPLRHTLKELDVDSCRMECLWRLFLFPQLEWLNISNNPLTNLDATVEYLRKHCDLNLKHGSFHVSHVGVKLQAGAGFDEWLADHQPCLLQVRCFPSLYAGVPGPVDHEGAACHKLTWWPRAKPFEAHVVDTSNMI